MVPDKARAAAEFTAGIRMFGDLLLTFDDLQVRVLGDWTARDVAAHFVEGIQAYRNFVEGNGSPYVVLEERAAVSAAAIRGNTETDPRALVERIHAETERIVASAVAIDGDPEVPWHTGHPMPISCALGLLVGEVIVHGWDLAQVAGVRWSVPDSWAHTVLRATTPMLPVFLDPVKSARVTSTYDIRMRGKDAPRIVLRLADQKLTVHQARAAGKVDCYLSGDPLALLLVLYGRKSPISQALRGKALAWGRKPWRGLTMPSLFLNP
jgi:uncharacterized protein (TIGR03083 family)